VNIDAIMSVVVSLLCLVIAVLMIRKLLRDSRAERKKIRELQEEVIEMNKSKLRVISGGR
jgi:hypothetical protein